MKGERLDVLLHKRGLVSSREKARSIILAGKVYVKGQLVDKPGTRVGIDDKISVSGMEPGYASRGGIKLAGAVLDLGLDFQNKIVLDVGASTGGFTDCALQNGASRVYAVDVGYGQLDWRLRQDKRVVVRERFNIRKATPAQFPEKMDIALIDVSFISLRLVLPVICQLLKSDGEIVALVKPQFEAGREQVGKKGVIKDPAIHEEVLHKVVKCASELGWSLLGLSFSPIKGPRGNIEYFVHFGRNRSVNHYPSAINDLVKSAHLALRG